MELQDFYNDDNDIWGKPQTFKNLEFYPILVVEKYKENLVSIILSHSKKEFIYPTMSVLERKAIYKASYLKALLIAYLFTNPISFVNIQKIIQEMLFDVCKLEEVYGCSKDDINKIIRITTNIEIDSVDALSLAQIKIIISINGREEVVFDESDFDLIRQLILKQNAISIKRIEQYHKDMEEKLIELSKDNPPQSFSDEIFNFASLSGLAINDDKFVKYTLYQFRHHLYFLRQQKDFEVMYPLAVSGKVKFDRKINYYANPYVEKGRYDGLLVTQSDFENSDLSKSVGNIDLDKPKDGVASQKNVFIDKINKATKGQVK